MPITIDKPMVLIPIEEYITLLKESDCSPTPALDKRITQARARFRKGKFIQWKKLKNKLV